MAVSLRTLLIVPFVLQVLGITGLVGYVSYRSGQRAVQDIVSQLMAETGQRVEASLGTYLQLPQTITRMNAQVMLNNPGQPPLDYLETRFLQQVQGFPEITQLTMTTPTGEFLGVSRLANDDTLIRHRNITRQDDSYYYYRGNADGQNRRLLETYFDDYLPIDPPEDAWYREARGAPKGFWQLVVTLHQGSDQPLLAMVRSQPVYDRRKELKGISSAGVLLPELGQVLQQVLYQREGQVLLLTTNGTLVATSTGESLLFTEEMGDLPPNAPAQYHQLRWYQSDNALTKAAVQHLVSQYYRLNNIKSPTFFTFWFESRPYFLHASPMEGDLDWLMVTAIPSQEFMATIYANLTRTLLFCALALLGSTGLGIWTAETITKPILDLQRATESFSLDAPSLPPSQPSSIKEVNALRQQFDERLWQLMNSLQTLRHREDTLAIFLDGVPVGISVHDTDGRMLFLNYKGQQILPAGILPSSLAELPKDYGLYLAGTQELCPVEDLPVAKGLRGKAAYTDNLEIDINGQRTPIEVHTIPVLDDRGQIRYCIAAFQDITERRQAEALRANYERELEQQVAEQTASIAQGNATKQALINAIPDLLMRLGRDGIPLEIYNLETANWIGDKGTAHLQSMYEALPPAIAAERRHCIELALTTGSIQRQEYEITVEGQKYWEEARIVPVTQDEVLVVVRDMSERHKIDRLKDEFIAMVSHELRTPLTAIRGALGILDSGVLQNRPDKAQHMLNVSLTNTDRLIRMVNDILNLERLASGKVKLVEEDCSVLQLMTQAMEGVEALALESGIQLRFCSPSATLWADPDAIVQTLVNLLSNAIKFSPAGSEIWLRAESVSPTTIQFSVTDQGRGIPADQCEVIFDRFQQVDVSDSRQRGGTGLGLAICKSIIAQHGGEIWVESVFGEGSTFYFTLPTRSHG
ncbi:MAG: ATP-binding protein [Spirulina sp.]